MSRALHCERFLLYKQLVLTNGDITTQSTAMNGILKLAEMLLLFKLRGELLRLNAVSWYTKESDKEVCLMCTKIREDLFHLLSVL